MTLIEFSVHGEVKRGASKTTRMDFRGSDFGLFRMLVERAPLERDLKEVQEGWTFFMEEVLKAQEQAVRMCCKTNCWGRRQAWLDREMLLGLRKNEPVGKTTSLAEQGALAGTQQKKEGLPLMEERAGDSRGVQGSR